MRSWRFSCYGASTSTAIHGHGVTRHAERRRNGSLLNPKVLLELTPAAIGQDWRTSIQMPGVTQSVLLIGLGGASEGSVTRIGELLIRPPFLAHRGASDHAIGIPDQAALVGVKFSTQALVLTEDGWKLTNALDVKVGSTSN